MVVTAPGDDSGLGNAGAVHLFNGASGKLISTIMGSHLNDRVGSGGVLALPDGSFFILSPDWGTGTQPRVGAATWVDGRTRISGVVSRDFRGINGGEDAATWCSGHTSLSGPVSSANSVRFIDDESPARSGFYRFSDL